MKLNKIDSSTFTSSIYEELEKFEPYYRRSVKSSVPLLNIITSYILKSKGKKIRPVLVFLSAKLSSGSVNESAHIAALMIELLHTATLVHDDVVDDSFVRRNKLSINALWKSKTAVLVGDFLLAQGLLVSLENDEFTLLKALSHAVKEMSEGELLQMKKALTKDYSEQEYFDIIIKKTASLMAACTKCGALAAGAESLIVERLYRIGLLIGILFQLKDDLLDYDSQSNTGKSNSNDLKEKKITLPLIYALNRANPLEKAQVLTMVKSNRKDKSTINKIQSFVAEKGGIEYTKEIIKEYKEKALQELSFFNNTEAKTNFINLVNYIETREK